PRWSWLEPGFFRALRGADLVIIQRRLLPGWVLRRVRQAARLLAFDFDDAVFLRDSFDPRGPECERRRLGFTRILQTADLVVAGNAHLREQAMTWAVPERVVLIPTCVTPALYPAAVHDASCPGNRLVWIGSGSTLRGLEKIGDLLDLLGRQLHGLNL